MNRTPPPKEEPAIPIEPDLAKIRATYVRDMVEKVKQLKDSGKSVDQIKEGTGKFSSQYPTLFKMVMKDMYDEAAIRTMVYMLEKMGTGELSQHQASVIVGQRLHDTYIKPKVDQLDAEAGRSPQMGTPNR
jgi:hypothetical protein